MRAAWITLALLAAAAVALPANLAGAVPRDEQTRAACSSRLLARLDSAESGDRIAVWIFFEDRGPLGKESPGLRLSSRAASRRALRGSEPLGDRDRPVHAPYVDALRASVLRIRHASRYFNAVSAEVAAGAIPSIAACPFVRSIDLVASEGRGPVPAAPASRAASPLAPSPYGASYPQLNLVGLIPLLDKGHNGSGAVTGGEQLFIGILDTGFRRDHEAFAGLAVEAEWDFINSDPVTSNQPGDPIQQDYHGTEVLGTIAGHAPGTLVGPAWGARYLLAKTEIVNEEIPIEEDHWVAGIEWADSAGADVVTSSLGYSNWYTRDQFDGHTALTTRAAGIAVSHGIVVVNSTGNRDGAGLVAPADGDSVLAAGAVDLMGAVASFSSRGPTADGRIKPDFSALGVGVLSVSAVDTFSYGFFSGTSFSAPMIAGVCALLLEIHPDWTPMDVRAALRATSSRSARPDNEIGWGIPDAAVAALYPSSFAVPGAFPNPFNTATRIQFSLPSRAVMTVQVFDVAGRLVKTIASGRVAQNDVTFTWDGTDEEGDLAKSGVYFIRALGGSSGRTVKVILIR